ncbi:MAG: hypothetical protein AABW49_02965 [Nanoarchaeota archaeon]
MKGRRIRSNPRSGQVTLFVIIGIILVLLLGLVWYYQSGIIQALKGEITQEELFRQNVDTLNGYVKTCLSYSSTEGINLIGLQGGYISLLNDPIGVSESNVLSNSLTVVPGLDVAYWYYETANGIQKTQLPSKEFMEEELANYIEEDIDGCLGGFVGFEILEIEDREKEVTVRINDETVDIKMYYPLKIEQEEAIGRLKEFEIVVPIPLGKLYGTAVSLFEKENTETFLEDITLDQFIVYEELPYSGIDLECSPKVWLQEKVFGDLKKILSTNIAHLVVKGSNYKSSRDKKYFEVDDIKVSSDSTVQFLFSEGWPLLIDVNPDEQVLKGESYNDNLLGRFITQFFCLNYYNFVYDLKYPILISITDEKTEYLFQYATQVIIQKNQPRESKITINYLDGKVSPVCDHYVTPLTINVQGYSTEGSLVSLDNAEISLQCVGTSCELGSTTLGKFNGNAPQCVNANVVVTHENYQQENIILTTVEEQTLTVLLEPKKELMLDLRLIRAEEGGTRGLLKDEFALVQFIHENNEYATSVIYPEQRSVTLIPGRYEVRTVIMMSGRPITLQGDTIKECIDVPETGVLGFFGLTKKKCTEINLDGATFDAITAGGANFGFELSRDQLINNEQITLFSVRNTEPRSILELQEMYKTIQENSQLEEFRGPILK